MMQESYVVSSPMNPAITLSVTPGHFATSNSHISHYLDVSTLRTSAMAAREVARSFAEKFLTSTEVNTIVCMENTEVIGAYLAEELLKDGLRTFNRGGEIRVMTPIQSVGGQLIFLPSVRKYIEGQNAILLMASVSSAKTASQALECLSYYGGRLVGILALFSAESSVLGQKIDSIFTDADIDGYYSARAEQCKLCKAGHSLDAIVTNRGYTEL